MSGIRFGALILLILVSSANAVDIEVDSLDDANPIDPII